MRKITLIILFISLLSVGCSAAPPVNLPTATLATNLAPPSATQTRPAVSVKSPTTPPAMATPTSTATPTAAPLVSAEQCQARLKSYLESQGGSDNRFPLEESQSLWGNPANWSQALIDTAKKIFGEKHVQDLIRRAGDLRANRYGVTKVIVGDNRQGLMVVTCPGGGYCWAVDKNGNFLNRMDGIGDPKMAGFKRIPDGPLGSRAVTVQKQGCTFRYYVGADGKVVSAFNPLFGQNNTPGQFRGTEPSNREATQTSQTATEQAKLDSPVAVAASLGYQECGGCLFQETYANKLLIGPGGVRGIQNDDGTWRSTKGWENLVNPLEIQRLSSGDMIVVNSFVAGLTEKPFPLVNGNGEVVGTNKFGYWMFYTKNGVKYAELVPVVVTGMQGETIVLASGYYGLDNFDKDPEGFIRSKLFVGKKLDPIFLKNVVQLNRYVGRIKELAVNDVINFLSQMLAGKNDTRDMFNDSNSGGVLPVWDFSSSLNGNKKVNIGQ